MKKIINVLMAAVLLVTFGAFALGSGESTEKSQNSGTASNVSTDTTSLGDYKVEIMSCRLAKDYSGKDIVIIKYGFTNNDDDSRAFFTAVNTEVFQGGVGLNNSYVTAEDANYSADNQTKEIKTGATLDVEVAYELNDNTTDLDVEVSELISLNKNKITKTFSIK
ncbi:MAG: DUF5067 domain-containing protein [Oscillospiraceae bacterium]|nr:DUF5067 domain-containing protein [Oscillospiraceae bacterium]